MRIILILTALIAGIAAAVHAQRVDFKKGGFLSDEYFIELPYQNINSKIIVELEIKGKKRRFLLDTGAPLAISQALFEELNPLVLTKQPIRDINQKTDSLLFVSVDSLKIGGVYASGIPAVVLKDNLILDCFKLDGFLGSNALRNSAIQFDSRSHVIRIASNISKLDLAGQTSSEILLDNQCSPFIKFNIGKRISEYVMFDSGSDVFYSMSEEKVKKFSKSKDFTITNQATGSNQVGLYGFADDELTSLLRIPVVQLNGLAIHNVISESSNSDNSRIGYGVLDYGVLTIDYKTRNCFYKQYTKHAAYISDQYQVSPTFIGNKLCIGKIWSKDLENLIAIGDEIVSIDDLSVESLSICDALKG